MQRKLQWLWGIGLAAISGLTAFNVFFKLELAERSGYYAIVATSMSRNWHNFFFGALDPAAMLGLDKIPGSYWVPAILVKLFGFHNRSVVAPNGVATILAVIVVAYTAKRLGGVWFGLLAGGLLATTPVIIAVARSNQPLSFFLLSMTIAAYCMTVALQTQSRRYLIYAGLAIGLAFQSYMIVAWAVWPALALAWLFTSRTWGKKILDLLIAGASSIVVSVTWITAVWLVPAGSRPYIGNTLHNNPWEMVFGYNGIGRFNTGGKMTGEIQNSLISFKTFTPPFSGKPSVYRFFYHQIIGQISWLIPATVVAILFLLVVKRHLPHVILFGTWFATDLVMFSAVSGMHQFYTATMAIPMVLLVAIALREAAQTNARVWRSLMVLATAAFSLVVLVANPNYLSAVPFIQLAFAVVFVIILFAAPQKAIFRRANALVAVLAISLTPLAWSVDARNHPSYVNPIAGPADTYNTEFAHKSNHSNSAGSDSNQASQPTVSHGKLVKYLIANQSHSKFMVVAFGVDGAASYILQSNRLVLPIGGFNGADPVPTLIQFKKMVARGEISQVLTNHFKGDSKQFGFWQSTKIKAWVKANCQKDYKVPQKVTLYACHAAAK
jgi:4-amino-4-deoxy-L-arabinose transferase-like glycosyltransferase